VAEPAELSAAFDFLPLFQRRNFGLALAVYGELAGRNQVLELDTGKRLRAARAHIPGRMEIHRLEGKTVILDGAHNEQKFQALMQSLKHRYPDQPVAALAGFKTGSTDRVENCTAELVKNVRHVVATTFGKSGNPGPHGEDPDLVAAMCKIHGFAEVEAVAEPAHAWRQLLRRPELILLVCGSFYLLSEIYPLLGDQVTLQ
jgi:folylpolyglutamate synthase/dihydropteroate synthase